MTQPPSWATSVPSTPGVHTEPPSSTQWENLTQEQIGALRTKLIQSIEQVITQDLTGGLVTDIPAADQLTQWATNLPSLGALITALTAGTGDPTAGYAAILSWASSIPGVGPFITALTNGNVDPAAGLAGLQAFFNFPGSTSGIMSLLSAAGADFVALVKSFIPGYTGTDQTQAQTDYGTITSNLLSVLGNPASLLSGGFNPITAAQSMLAQVLAPAGVLTTFTQLPPHLFSAIMPGADMASLLPDPNFSSSQWFDGQDMWDWASFTDPSIDGPAGSAHTTGQGVLKQLVSMPIPIGSSSNNIAVGTSLFWNNVVASGDAFTVAIDSYTGLNADGTVSGPPITDAHRVVTKVTNPASTSGLAWQPITGTYVPPAGTKYVTFTVEALPGFASGDVWFTKNVFDFAPSINAALLGNMANLPTVFLTTLEGYQGLVSGSDTWGHMLDGIGTAVTSLPQNGLQFSDLFAQLGNLFGTASQASTLATSHAQILGNVTNFPLTSGLDPTAEATFDLAALPHGSTMPTTTLATGNAIGGPINVAKSVKKGFIEFIGSLPAGNSGIYVNLYRVNQTTGLRTNLWASSDIASLIPTAITSTTGMVKVPIAGSVQPQVNASDQLHAEIVNASGAALTLGYKQSPQPTRATGIIRNYGIHRVTGGNTAPATIADSQFTYDGITPWISAGVANVPANYQAPVKVKFTTPAYPGSAYGNLPAGYWGNAQPVGSQVPYTTSYTLPSWFRPGIDYVDFAILGGGGGGDSGSGGSGGPAGPTSITVDGVTHTAAGGPAANSGGNVNVGGAASVGRGAGTQTYDGQQYQAGGDVSAQAFGSVPGGGGGGGAQFVGYTTYYGAGAQPGSWLTGTLQPVGTTIAISLGFGGHGQPNYSAAPGADGGVFLYIYQNPTQ